MPRLSCPNLANRKYWSLQAGVGLGYQTIVDFAEEEKASTCPVVGRGTAKPPDPKTWNSPAEDGTKTHFIEGQGTFEITSYPDGFLVSKLPEVKGEKLEKIEINLIGALVQEEPEEYVQVHVSYGTRVHATVADMNGNSYDCKINVDRSHNDYVPCTIAGFGR